METLTMEDQKLKDYFKFDEADLEANRNGRFSESQQVRLIENDRKIQRRWGWRSIPFLLIAAIGPVAALGSGDFFGWSWKIMWGFVWTGVWGGIGLAMLISSLSKQKPLVLAKATGKVNIVRDRSYRSSTHTHNSWLELHIGRHVFDMDEELVDIMMQGDEYIVYYEKDWDEIISAERVSNSQ
jgi:hypothetical protein